MLNKLYHGAALVSALFLFVACGASKKTHEERLYLQGADSIQGQLVTMPEQKIQPGDLLTILIYSDNKEATEIYNQPQSPPVAGVGGGASSMTPAGRGYLVDPNGKIVLHEIGELEVLGKTRKELGELIRSKLAGIFLTDPYVVVRFANARISVLGEVNRPGQIEMPDQRLTILEAIALSGDLTSFGRRDNILVVREQASKRFTYRVNIRDAKLYSSPVFFLQQNDVIYIEPNKRKPTGNDQMLVRNITIVSSVASMVALVVSLLIR